jgi:hypothetical protein
LGIETVTLGLVAQCLNKLRPPVPPRSALGTVRFSEMQTIYLLLGRPYLRKFRSLHITTGIKL